MPSPADIQRIANLADPVLRNLQITQTYHELASDLRTVTGAGANWCTFATWASKQAGQTIRHEDLARAAMMLLRISPAIESAMDRIAARAAQLGQDLDRARLRDTLFTAVGLRPAVVRAGEAVARGNLKVFAELGPIFVRYVDTFAPDQSFDAGKTARFAESLLPGEPPDGQGYLREAFTTYAQARFATDAIAQAQLQFHATVLIGAHEQVRLQPDIVAALDAPFTESVEDTRRRILSVVLPGFVVSLRYRLSRLLGRTLPLDHELDQLIEAVRTGLRELTSRFLMTLRLPDGKNLRLGRDLRTTFAPSLQQVHDAKLRELIARFDATPDSLDDTGARDWADFADRMHFILDYFRCYAEHANLFAPPFTAAQTDAIKRGRKPEGPL
jgi:hypothetical protein